MSPYCYLVIGSTGLIGSKIVSNLSNQSIDLYTISRSKVLNTKSIKHYDIDLLEEGSIELVISELKLKYEKIKVFYLAGITSVKDSIDSDYSNILLTIKSYAELINSLKGTNSSIVFASSGAVYNANNINYLNEFSSLRPISSYAVSKQCCESISYLSSNIDIKIARLFSVYGENMNRFFIYDLIKKLLNSNSKVTLNGDGSQIREYMYVDEVAKGLIFIMDYGVSGEVYNLCSGNPVNLKNLANKISEILNKNNVEIIWNNKKSISSYDKWYGNPLKLYNLGFHPRLDFESQLKKTVLSIKNKIQVDT